MESEWALQLVISIWNINQVIYSYSLGFGLIAKWQTFFFRIPYM